MKKNIRIGIRTIIVVLTALSVFSLSSCEWLSSKTKSIKGELKGNHFDINFYDNNGDNILNIDGKKVGIEANYIKEKQINSDGQLETAYSQTSVITITVDGNQVAQTGNTVIFVEDGIEKIEDFSLPETITTDGGTINILDRNINRIKNILGTSKVVVVCSQLGTPIAVYGGDEVYWEVPDDLPKTTKLSIDGKALYIHRANYILLDTEMIN